MSRLRYGSSVPSTLPLPVVPRQPHHFPRFRQLFFTLVLMFTLSVNILGGWTTSTALAFAFTFAHSTKPTLTFQQFLKHAQQTPPPQPFIFPRKTPPIPFTPKGKAKPAPTAPSAEPPTMKPLTSTLTPAFLKGGPNATPIDLIGSDHRLEVQLTPGSFDLSHALNSQGHPFHGVLVVTITQIHGHFATSLSLLGRYLFALTDSHGQTVTGIRLRSPITFIYHYQLWEMSHLGLDPGHLLFSWPNLLAAVRKQPTSHVHHASASSPVTGAFSLVDDPKAHTLTAESTVFDLGPFDVGGGQINQGPPSPHLASTEGNSGQFAYSYPIQLPPGPAGFSPQLALSYSSSDPNERHSTTAPPGDVGDGWSLGLGAITEEIYPNGSASSGPWYFLSGLDNVSDRLIHASSDQNETTFVTEHQSHLHIQMLNSCYHTSEPCFVVYDTSGTEYVFGDTYDSLQYQTNSDGTQQIYRWDLRLVMSPHDDSVTAYDQYQLSYLQDCVPAAVPCPGYGTNGASGTTIRDAVIKQLTVATWNNGTQTTTATADFSYLAPFNDSSWASAYNYGHNYNCADGKNPPISTPLRCDDPQTLTNGGVTFDAPSVMSTFELQTVTTYVGNDSDSSRKLASYSFHYNDYPFFQCWDNYTQYEEYCAGEHILLQVTPTRYLKGTGYQLKPIFFNYAHEADHYYDSQHDNLKNAPFGGATNWFFLTNYIDSNTGIGDTITYQEAHNNSHGTPNYPSDDGPTDFRTDALYCSRHTDQTYGCYNAYANPDDQVWSVEVVKSIQTWGTDSSKLTQPAITTFNYQLAVAIQGSSEKPPFYCNPAGSDTRCVGDDYIPANQGVQDSDWQDYYHAEFRGFNAVYITNPANNLTADYYFSTEGWATGSGNSGNYDAGHLYEEDRYSGNTVQKGILLTQTRSIYGGNGWWDGTSTMNSCDGSLNIVYAACVVALISTRTLDVEGGDPKTAPWVETDYQYDDYDKVKGLQTGYHNLELAVTNSSNGPTMQGQWSYAVNDNAPYYTVNKVKHSELDAGSGNNVTHVWQCQDITYDEGANTPTPVAGWPTTIKTYSDCSNQSSTAITNYLGYDAYGNVVASVDGLAAAHSNWYGSSGITNKNGCTLNTAPVFLSDNWTAGAFTSCATYDTPYEAQPTTVTNAFSQSSSSSYDDTQESLPTQVSDPNGQATSYAYSYDGNSGSNDKGIVSVSEPGECGQPGCYTDQTNTFSSCVSGFPGGTTSPCYETDSASSLYSDQFGSTFYDSQGRAVETTVPGPAPASPKSGMSYFTVTMTVYDDQQGSSWQSLPFVVAVQTNPSGPTGTGWLDPETITDYTGATPGGTAVYRDALGRTITTQDPMLGSQQEPGINCPNLPDWLQQLNLTYTTCAFYGLGQAQGDNATYSYTGSIDPNNHVSVSFANMMGWALYTQRYNGTYSGPGIGNISGNLIQQQAVTDNILGEPVTITTTDEKTNQSITVTMQYDDLGQMTSESDPETGSYTYSYDPDGNLLSAVSGTRTLGYNYDLLGRVGCVQDATPTLDADGSCTSGTHPYLQYIYDSDKIGGTSYPVGRLTKTIATMYYPDSGTPSASASEKYAYDTRGRLTTEQLLFNLPSAWNVTNSLPTYQMSYAYNDDDQLYGSTSSTDVNGSFTTQYSTTQIYDQNTGVQTGLGTTSSTPTLGTLAYNNSALPDTLTYLSTGGNPLVNETFSYDGNLRLTGASACWQSSGCNNTGGTIFSQSRGFDVASNVTSAVTQMAGVPGVSNPGKETQIFCYDAQNRLVWAGNSGTVPSPGNGTCGTGTPGSTLSEGTYQNAYSYGHFDQLTQGPFSGTQGQQYLYCNTSTPHQLTGIYASSATCSNKSGKVYGSSYDSWGNVVTRTLYNEAQLNPATLSYDLLNHFIEWQDTDPNTNITTSQWNLYDANGERVLQRSTNNGTTTLIAYPFGNEEYHYTAGGTLQSSLHYDDLGGQLLDERSGSTTTMLITDALGSVISTFSNTQNNAAVLGNQLYDPYGNQRLQAGSIDNSTSRGFTGQYNDNVTGLDYYGARYYDPAAGVFLAADSVEGNAVSMNPYGYVAGNPETMTDPTGKFVVDNGQEPIQGGDPQIVIDPEAIQQGIGSTVQGIIQGIGAFVTGVATLWGVIAASAPFHPRSITVKPTAAPTPTTTPQPDEGSAPSQVVNGATLVSVLGKGYHYQTPGSTTPSTPPSNNKPVIPEVDGGPPPLPHVGPEPCSFTPDTPVTTDHGKLAIGKLHVGEKVLAYNPKTHKMELEPILHVWIHKDSDLVDLTITTNTHAPHSTKGTKTQEVLHTNQKHPFYTLEKGFVPVGQLKLGMHVLRADGQIGVITGWKVVPGTKVMYNLEVANDHTFVVGQGQWVVHNDCNRPALKRAVQRTGTLINRFAAHHIIPCELEGEPLVQRAGLNINAAINGIGLPMSEGDSTAFDLPQHSGSHPDYTNMVRQMLDNATYDLREEYGNWNNVPQDVAMNSLMSIISSIRERIINAGGDCRINDV